MKRKLIIFLIPFAFILLIPEIAPAQESEKKSFCPNMKPFIASFGNFTICSGYNLILYSNQGNALTYQWLLNGKAINGATNSVYYASTPGIYSIWVTQNGCTNISDEVLVKSGTYPTVQIFPSSDLQIAEGDSVELKITGGTSWQWFKNYIPIAGATQKSFFATDSGYYHAEASNGGCTVASPQRKVIVLPKPELVNTSSGFDLSIQDTIVLHVNTPGNYQWYKNHHLLPGEIQNELKVYSPGIYSVEVDNGIYKVMSADIEITLEQVLAVYSKIQNRNLLVKNNPFTAYTQIEFTNGYKPDQIVIRTIQGEIIFTQSGEKISNEFLWGENAKKGIYFLQLKQGDTYEVLRLIKN